jgi:hypothetical protein
VTGVNGGSAKPDGGVSGAKFPGCGGGGVGVESVVANERYSMPLRRRPITRAISRSASRLASASRLS